MRGTRPRRTRTGDRVAAGRRRPPRPAADRTAAARPRRRASPAAPARRRRARRATPSPAATFVPERVTTLITDDAERPRSAPNRFVAIWNSCTASIGRFSSGPPTTSSLLSWPSMVMLPPRPICPADAMSTLLVLVGSKIGVGALPGTRSASSRKFRPLSGSASMRAADSTPSTAVLSGPRRRLARLTFSCTLAERESCTSRLHAPGPTCSSDCVGSPGGETRSAYLERRRRRAAASETRSGRRSVRSSRSTRCRSPATAP